MQIRLFRGDEFVDREKEIEFFLNYFNQVPNRILWVYGPKSTGKTTLIEYIIENELDKNKTIRYINFRRTLISSYDSFLNSILEEKDEESEIELNRIYNIFNLFKLEAKTLKKIKEDKKNLFNYLIEEVKKTKDNIFIIDEIQTLEDIYINGGRLLLNEFLNFCVSLTKETHLSHVVILTSNTLFLEKIYNNSKLKKTSDFRLIDHLEYGVVKEWLKTKGFNEEEIDLIYDYLGGCAIDIKKMVESYKYFNSLKEYLKREAKIASNEIRFFFESNKIPKEEREMFFFVAEEIVKNGFFDNSKYEGYFDVISKFCEVEILFFDPIEYKTCANSRIYVKAFEILLKEIR